MEKYFPSRAFAGRRVHLGVSGSVAAYKALDLLRALQKCGLRVSVGITGSAAKFVTPLSFRSLGAETVYSSMFPADGIAELGESYDPFGPLTPGAEAEAFIVLPASATTMARVASGLADEILSAQALAFPGRILFAPAMNPRMWSNPATKANCARLRELGHVILEPVSGKVACNEEGQGKLVDLRQAYLAVLKQLSPQDYAGKKVMITMGPTREQWDGVRFWSNLSTGTMGAAYAVAAYLRGAEVHAVCGPGCPWLPPEVNRIDVSPARDMYQAVMDIWPQMDYGIFSAAVADFYPEAHGTDKFKKDKATEGLSISFLPNPDILSAAGAAKGASQRIVGMAAETGNLEDNVRGKLKRKNADMLVGNLVGVADSGFASPLNRVFIADRNGREESWDVRPKS
ncbi:bifunctional phosphopantothenoylcysteine decarboxylase/phosphopantothenate--cysteine ligase CoaBC, partial [Desulfovibrio sp. OttesenSCG-928-C06]|nr:bifunctional phosphopantothenoylcysteine decarboxylase/phosphopantothenate--cysteine ligase CoaBC [Desulfovibrio sp. OttesenSCG-928-C06]